jgi:hypothetical protein
MPLFTAVVEELFELTRSVGLAACRPHQSYLALAIVKMPDKKPAIRHR